MKSAPQPSEIDATTEGADLASVFARRYGRRDVLRGGLLGLGIAALSHGPLSPASALAKTSALTNTPSASSLTFAEVPRGLTANHVLAPGYSAQPLLRWGDALFEDSPPFDPHALTPEGAAKQFGYNCDHIQFFPLNGSTHHGLLCVNHEFTNVELAFPGSRSPEQLSRTEQLTDMQMHGASVVEVRQEGGQWRVVKGAYNRRITASTPMELRGPAAGDVRLQTSADPTGRRVLGTFANCAGGKTPWGTYLTCEENVDVFFHLGGYDGAELANHTAFGLGHALYHRWDLADARFDVASEPREPNRFGWVVEIDPHHPDSTPTKRTALGRIKHESATCALAADGRLAIYTGDDEHFQCLYRYLSHGRVRIGDAKHNDTLLDDGVLSVAQFHDDGTLRWLPLVFGQGPLTPENGFASQADVLIETRRAAILIGGTPMDRPEDIEVHPQMGCVYVSLTKNPERTSADSVNRRAPDPMGYVLEIAPARTKGNQAHHEADVMRWDIFLEGGDPRATASLKGHYGGTVSAQGWLACPDNLAIDGKGRLWIATDGMEDALGLADGVYATDTCGPGRAITKAFFRGPMGSELTGPCFSPDSRTLFVSVQHPGEGSGSDAPSTRWPDFDPKLPPRPTVLAIRKDDGGLIGG